MGQILVSEPYQDDNQDYAQDTVAFRRIIAWEVRRLSQELQSLQSKPPASIPWWQPILFGLLITMTAGYIGLVHQMALTDRAELARVAAIQWQRSSLVPDVEEIKRRILANEQLAQRIPALESTLRDISQKLDRLIERREERRVPY